MLMMILTVGLARADAQEDLLLAASSEQSESVRLAAFERLVQSGATSARYVSTLSVDATAATRQRWVAIRALGHIGGPAAESALLSLLDDPEPAIRTAAVGALGELGSTSNSAAVASCLTDPAIIVRAAATESLSRLRDPTTISALALALEDPSNYHRGTSLWVRRHYVLALGEIGDVHALPVLLRVMEDSDPEVAAASLTAFERIAGFSFADGRSPEEEQEAWRRWASGQVRGRGL